MNTKPDHPFYQKLPGRGGSFLGPTRLWLATDHLLRVELRGFAETYHRFYFSDIQAILVRPTNQWFIELAVMGPMLLVLLLLALVSADAFRVFWLVLAGLVLPFFLLQLFRGRTCTCHIQTAVQFMSLPSVNRMRYARKILGLLKPMIEQAQGTMAPEEMLRALENAPPPVMPTARATAPVQSVTARAPAPVVPKQHVIRHSHGRWHEVTCWALAADAMLSSLYFFMDNEVIQSVGTLMFVVLLALVITACVKQLRTDLPRQLKYAMWSMLGYMIVGTLVVIAYVIVATIRDPMRGVGQFSPSTDSFMLWMNASGVLASSLVAALGLISLHRFRREYAVKEPPPPPLPVEAGVLEGRAPSRPAVASGHDEASPSNTPGNP
jgi:hypothetical protein